MLFTGLLACFSPSVPADVRALWGMISAERAYTLLTSLQVRNGGELTHTATDFRHAMFFFCDSMNDPWLSELLSRYLIVRHAAWVTRCVSEDFYMPMAPYTLDDGFDESRALILDPSVFINGTQRGRPAETEDLTNTSLNRRCLVDAVESPQTTKRSKVSPSTADKNNDTGDDTLIEPEEVVEDKTTHFISLALAVPRRRGKVSKAVKKFESCISIAPPKPHIEAPKQNHSTPAPLTPHTVYWNEVFAKAYACDGPATLALSINDLLKAPPTRAAIFDVNKSYLGKRFINNDQGA